LSDFIVLQQHIGQIAPSTGEAVVPEPNSCVLGCVGLTVVLLLRLSVKVRTAKDEKSYL
jgi:hypothetical protein